MLSISISNPKEDINLIQNDMAAIVSIDLPQRFLFGLVWFWIFFIDELAE